MNGSSCAVNSPLASHEWNVEIAGDSRTGELLLRPVANSVVGPEFVLTMSELFKQLGFTREQLLGCLDDSSSATPASSSRHLEELRLRCLPDRLDGLTVLDLGGYDGALAYECLRRGALSSIVVDNEEWSDYHWPCPRQLPGVRYVRGDAMDWSDPADLVICYNLIYHLPDPLGAIRHFRKLTRQTLALCTSVVWNEDAIWRLFDASDPGEKMLNGRYTVFFKPSPRGLIRALQQSGFSDIEEIGKAGDHFVVRCQ